jgi:hypothetical protein
MVEAEPSCTLPSLLDLSNVDHGFKSRGEVRATRSPIPERSAQRILKVADAIPKAGTTDCETV